MKNKKKKIGFTLIELLAVIIVLAIIALIATPIIFNVIENAKLKSLENSCYGVIDAVRTKYAEGLLNSIDGTVKLKGNVTEITVAGEQPIAGTWEIDNSSNPDNRGIKIKDVKFGSMKDYTCTNVNSDGTINSKVTCTKGGNNDEPTSEYTDNSGANKPVLLDNMVAIKYENEKWLVANTSQKWYDYDAKEWANAVVLNSGITKNIGDEVTEEDVALWYVWIPRYKYTIFNGNNGSASAQLINVTFESGTNRTGTVTCTDNADGSETCSTITNGTSTYTHPAFKLGNTELTGFWVGKFEVSGSTSAITVKPNVSSLRSQTVSSFFTAIQNVKTTYGINNADSHMLKNMEWGAVAYLKQSKYGLGTTDIEMNTSSNFYTGGGTRDAYKTNVGQSTTGNIYGVYDMSGGAWEYVMGNMKNSSNAFYSSKAGFTTAPDAKYYDSYKYDSSSNTTHARGKLGDATKETLATFGSTSGWYSDYAGFPDSSVSWFIRGGFWTSGTGAGVFSFGGDGGSDGSAGSARAVLSAQ
ncbi:MAG: prepilin-type N-terminal cleavage/methylation domain-containing protein [Acholeplasma sp.]|nr:prepilin-type N-terminal cleavage/methylation domain-containing protein [Acholeplasma sp.]